ncbi:MAG TPA: hypothetical protein VNH18_27335, partial [Bryobacteraceae bacterium]|nr:hypothetical protein [Bryobacteraceae bacterium]
TTKFEALVDGTNGNTVLKPVTARLGNTPFTTSGAIIRHEDVGKRAIELTVHMRDGDLRDILRLAMKKAPFMQGAFGLDAKIAVPPLSGKVREKLLLNGNFTIVKGMFRNDAVQDKVDELSRRGQGEPTNAAIDDVAYNMRGRFDMRGEVMRLTDISFRVPGAAVRLNGTYDLGADNVDFHGELRLDAKVSQTMTGWKRWAAIPLNPLFAKDGAGTLLKIQISGNAGHPVIGKDKGDEKHAPGGELRDPAR